VFSEGNLLRVASAARGYRDPRLSIEDPTREGGVGPMKVADKFEPDKAIGGSQAYEQGGRLTRKRKARPDLVPPRRCPGSRWWPLSKRGVCRTEVLTMGCDGVRALPVFSGEGEAHLFAWLGGAFEDGWRAREASVGELISTLYGPCAHVRAVALDPSPEMTGETIGLVSMSPKKFLDRPSKPGTAADAAG
jgi:hypothetical protein